ncbi:MAG: hypothetical protein ACRCXD_18030 [Luteolibacter sp.]
MANNQFRVEIPNDPTETIKLLGAIKAKHEALGATSPLGGLKWAEISPALAVAAEQDKLSDDFRSKAEAATGARDAKMTMVKDSIRSARDVLMGLNRDNPDALGEFGFKVSDARSGGGGETPPVG